MTASEVEAPSQTLFGLVAPLLSAGREDTPVASSDGLTLTVKVYASGGENALHAHPGEDHSFVVLAGSARFEFGDSTTADLGVYDGVLLPRGTFYKFQSTGAENLVMLRAGAPVDGPAWDRIAPDKKEMPADSEANKHVPAVRIPGKYFGRP